MALDSYSDDNKQTKNGLVISYTYTSKLVDTGHDTITGTHVAVWRTLYCVTRTAKKQYSYIGMTYAAAKQCALDKIAKYTRTKKGWQYAEDGIRYSDCSYCGVECVPTHTEGDMWQCDINVNERDDVWTFATPSNPAGLFSYIDCDYDE